MAPLPATTGDFAKAQRVVGMCRHVVNALARGECGRQVEAAIVHMPGAEDRMDYVHFVACSEPAAYCARVVSPGMTEDFDAEFGRYVRLAEFTCEGEVVDYVLSGFCLQGQYVHWGAQGNGYFRRWQE